MKRAATGPAVLVLVAVCWCARAAYAQTPPAPATGTAGAPQVTERPLNPTQEVVKEQPEGPGIPVGPAQMRVGGYLGLTGIFRSTNSGGGPGTSFASIPYEDVVQGNVAETRLSAQSSRLSLRVDAEFTDDRPRFHRLSGYFEMDFNGTTPGTIAVTSSGAGFRLRHAFAEVRYGTSWFLAAGQAFSLMTPAKNQLSIWPSDYELSQAVDTNYLAGLLWDRAPQFRLTWRPSARVNWAVSAENPEQQLGAGIITLPRCCADDIAAQYNTGSLGLETPNMMPDIVTRVALNPIESFHVDVGGVLRAFRHTVSPYDESFKDVGGGVSVHARLNLGARTKLFGQGAFGSGLGRYVGGLVPDVAFRADGSIDTIDTTAWAGGVERTVTPALSLGAYYSGVNASEAFSTDTDGAYIGFGYPGSSYSNNRQVAEVTATAAYQVAKSADRGSVQFNVQTSWLTRKPWSDNRGLSSASAFMLFAQLRYNLP